MATAKKVLGYLYDIGELGRLVMAAENDRCTTVICHGNWKTNSPSVSAGFWF